MCDSKGFRNKGEIRSLNVVIDMPGHSYGDGVS